MGNGRCSRQRDALDKKELRKERDRILRLSSRLVSPRLASSRVYDLREGREEEGGGRKDVTFEN